MAATMVFIHGRGQEFKNPAALIKNWRAGLAGGLIKANMPPHCLSASCAAVLRQSALPDHRSARPGPDRAGGAARNPDEAGPLHPGLPEDIGSLERSLLADMASVTGAPVAEDEAFGLDQVLSWGGAGDALTWIAGHTGVDQAIIVDHLRDVAVYLTRARDQVLGLVRAAIPAAGRSSSSRTAWAPWWRAICLTMPRCVSGPRSG